MKGKTVKLMLNSWPKEIKYPDLEAETLTADDGNLSITTFPGNMKDGLSKETRQFRKRSGSVKSKDSLVSFLYILMRNELTPGKVEAIMMNHIEPFKNGETKFCNGWLAMHAKDIARRLR